jgi:hypothetical protein
VKRRPSSPEERRFLLLLTRRGLRRSVDLMLGSNPSITGTAIVKALDPNQATARHQDAVDAQAVLDETDLREEERAAYYDDAPPVMAPAETAPRRSLLARLRRR